MTWLPELLTTHLLLFLLTLARLGGFVATAPLFSTIAVPWHIRGFLTFALALLLAPTQGTAAAAMPATLLDFLPLLAIEVLIGMALGLGTAILLSGAQLAGQLIAQISGLSMAEIFDPASDANLPVLSQLVYLFAVATYLSVGGHRWLVAGLLDTFVVLPPGQVTITSALPQTMIALTTESFALGIRVAAPAVIAVLLATLLVGLVSRTLPQLNVMSLGFGLNTLAAFGALAISLGTAAWLFEEQLFPAITLVRAALESPPRGKIACR